MVAAVISLLALVAVPIVVISLVVAINVLVRKKPAPNRRDLGMALATSVGITVAISFGLAAVFRVSGIVDAQFFRPSSEDFGEQHQLGFEFEEVRFRGLDGAALHGFFLPAQANSDPSRGAMGTVVHFHGSDLNASYTVKNAAWLVQHGFNVFAFDYRGYGRSQGTITRQGLINDGVAAIEYVCGRADVNSHKVILWGQSMGGQLAINAAIQAARPELKGVVSEATYANYQYHVKDKFSMMGPLWLMQWSAWLVVSDACSAEHSVAQLAPVPLLLVHGSADRVALPYHSEWLFERAESPKQIWRAAGAGHLRVFHNNDNQKLLVDYLKKACL